MSSPNPSQPTHGWQTQRYQQPPARHQHNRYPQVYPQAYPQDYFYYGQNAPDSTPYVQPYHGNTSPAPMIAELPAPLPPAPPTTTPSQQLKEDELFAHQIQQLEVAEIRRTSSGALSQHQRAVSLAPPSPPQSSPLMHQRSSHSLRPHSQSVSSFTRLPTHYQSVSSFSEPYSPGSFGPPPNQPSPSSLPEVVVGPRPVSYHRESYSENLPIPVIQDQQPTYPLSVPLDPASLSAYLEQHRQVPYPPQWTPPSVLATFYAYAGSHISKESSWLDTPESCTWRTIRPTEHAHNPAPPSYTFKFKTSSGSFRSPKHSWIMTCPEQHTDATNKVSKARQPAWAYDLKLDSNTGMRKTEVLTHGHAKAILILTTYVHALNYDSLRFIGPDGCAYMWVSSSKVSSINGSRYDTLRHALFVAAGNIPDPLYGQIVADHAFWDGFVDENEVHIGVRCEGCQMKPITGLRWRCRTCPHHDVCNTCRTLALTEQYGASIKPTCDFSLVNLPDEALYIRSPNVDPALAIATLQVLKDWEKHTLRDEKRRNITGFLATEETARKCDLGVMSYWKASDGSRKSADGEKHGTRVKAKGTMKTYGESAGALGNLADAGFALAGVHGTSSVGGGDGDGGGGGGGGGSCGSGNSGGGGSSG